MSFDIGTFVETDLGFLVEGVEEEVKQLVLGELSVWMIGVIPRSRQTSS